MRTLRGDGHEPQEIAEMVGRDYTTVLKHLNEPEAVEYLAFKRREILDAVGGAAGALALHSITQLKGCLDLAPPEEKPKLANSNLKYALDIMKLAAQGDVQVKAEHLKIERTMGHVVGRPEELTDEERLSVIRKTALGHKKE